MEDRVGSGLCVACLLTAALTVPEEEDPALSTESLLQRNEFVGYELHNEIARGGMGVVFRARQMRPDRLVALKVIAAGELASPRMVERFHAETEAAARLDHPHIASIYEAGQQDGWHFFSMKLIDGPTLAKRLSGMPMPAREAAQLFVKVARAVHHAHQRGVLHRDIKPSNILLDPHGEPHLTDFGLAKIMESDASLTHTNIVMGTPAYMPPEQALGNTREVTVAADVYSLGAVFYEMLTGQPPFTAATTPALLRKIVDEEVRPPMQVLRKSTATTTTSAFTRELDVICLKALEKDPSHRYGTAAALADDIERWLRGETIQAQAASRMERVRKWVRRYPARSGLIATAALALLVITIGSLVFNVRLREARDTAEQNAADARRQLVGNHLTNAARLTTDGDAFTAALSLLEARRHADSESQPVILERLQWTLQLSPRLLRLRDARGTPVKLEFSKEGQVLTVTLRNGNMLEWNLPADMLTPLPRHGDIPKSGEAISPNGRWRLKAAGTNAVLTDRTSGTVIATYPVTGPLHDLNFSPDSAHCAIASFRDQVRVFECATGKPVGVPLLHESGGNKALYSPDGTLLATAGFDYHLVLRHATRHTPVAPAIVHSALIEAVAFSPNGRFLAVGSADGVLQVWDLQTAVRPLLVDGGFVRRVAVSPDTEFMILTGSDGTLRAHRVADGAESGPRMEAGGDVGGVQFSADGHFLAAACRQRGARVWDFRTRQLLHDLKSTAELPDITQIAIHPGGDALITSADKGSVQHRKLNGDAAPTMLPRTEGIRFLRWSADGKWFAAGMDSTLQVWDAATRREAPVIRADAGTHIWDFSFSPDSRRILATFSNGSVEPSSAQFYELPSLQPAGAAMRHGDGVGDARISPDGKFVATAGEDNVLRVWHAADGGSAAPPLRHSAIVRSPAFRGDNRLLASTCADGLLRLWDPVRGELAAPPFYAGTSAGNLVINRRGDTIFYSARRAETWFIRPRANPVPDSAIAPLTECQAGHRMDASHGPTPLTAEEMETKFTGLKTNYSSQFTWPGDTMTWHRERAAVAESGSHWFAAAVHLERLAALLPDEEIIQQRLAEARRRTK